MKEKEGLRWLKMSQEIGRKRNLDLCGGDSDSSLGSCGNDSRNFVRLAKPSNLDCVLTTSHTPKKT